MTSWRCAHRRQSQASVNEGEERIDLSIIVPTFNEAPNIEELVRRISAVTVGMNAEIVVVDDSTDATPAAVLDAASWAELPVRLIHRATPDGGLGGAVVEGLAAAKSDLCLVMDADLQHPPEIIPSMLQRYSAADADIVIASRYAGGGTSGGLSDTVRVLVSRISTLVTKAMFPIRLHQCSDPMTGFFLLDRRIVDVAGLKPRGFKILLEILARQNLTVAEVPFDFADRHAGESKASLRQGMHFVGQLAHLRFGKMSIFAVIGALGAVVNLGIMATLTAAGLGYIWAAVIAAELTIIGNFLLIEHFVFKDMREAASSGWVRFASSFSFNNAEALIRIPIIYLMVETGHFSSIFAAAITLIVAFFARFVFHSLVVYAPRRSGSPKSRRRRMVEKIDEASMQPGEL